MYSENKATFGVRKSNFVGRVIAWMKTFRESSFRACSAFTSTDVFSCLIRFAFCRRRTGSYDSDRMNKTRMTATPDYIKKLVSEDEEATDRSRD